MATSSRREFAVQCGSMAAGLSLGQVLGPREASAAPGQLELSLDIMGLNAFVLDRAAARAEVLLVDPGALGSGMPRHTPFLVANLRDITNPPEDSRPTTVSAVPSVTGGGLEQLGLWDLTDRQVLIRQPGGAEVTTGLKLNMPENEAAGLTLPKDVDDPEAWRDLRYVVDMERICGRSAIAEGLSSLGTRDGRRGQEQVPPIVGGRVRLAGGVLEGAIPSLEATGASYSASLGPKDARVSLSH